LRKEFTIIYPVFYTPLRAIHTRHSLGIPLRTLFYLRCKTLRNIKIYASISLKPLDLEDISEIGITQRNKCSGYTRQLPFSGAKIS